MKIISLGGVGGCELAKALRQLNQAAYPYDWLITTQHFILNSFNHFNHFIAFDEAYVYDNTKLITYDKSAIMLHDFNNFVCEKEKVIMKYKKRFDRLNESLTSNEDILFVRIYDNLKNQLIPTNYYNNILTREEEDLQKWELFINYIQCKYTKKIKLLIITNREDICVKRYSNIFLCFTNECNTKNIYDIIQNTLNSEFIH